MVPHSASERLWGLTKLSLLEMIRLGAAIFVAFILCSGIASAWKFHGGSSFIVLSVWSDPGGNAWTDSGGNQWTGP